MLSTFFFHLDVYWLAWTNLFPSLPLWSPHGAVMTPILLLAASVLGGKYLMQLASRA